VQAPDSCLEFVKGAGDQGYQARLTVIRRCFQPAPSHLF